jgi:hypothetical protein
MTFDISGHFKTASDDTRDVVEFFLVDGLLHREGGPAWIKRDRTTGTVLTEVHYIDGQLQSPGDQPAQILRFRNGRIEARRWYSDGQLNRDPLRGPAIEEYDQDGELIVCEFYVAGMKAPGPTKQRAISKRVPSPAP